MRQEKALITKHKMFLVLWLVLFLIPSCGDGKVELFGGTTRTFCFNFLVTIIGGKHFSGQPK